MKNSIALAVPFVHTSCSETSPTATASGRVVINAAIVAGFQGTSLPISGTDARTFDAYGMPKSGAVRTLAPSGHLTWSPPV
jgi:hypothetical protein